MRPYRDKYAVALYIAKSGKRGDLGLGSGMCGVESGKWKVNDAVPKVQFGPESAIYLFSRNNVIFLAMMYAAFIYYM